MTVWVGTQKSNALLLRSYPSNDDYQVNCANNWFQPQIQHMVAAHAVIHNPNALHGQFLLLSWLLAVKHLLWAYKLRLRTMQFSKMWALILQQYCAADIPIPQ